MRGGRLEIKGDAGALLGSGISGGQIVVKGSAAGQVGGLSPGDKFGMTGGLIVIDGQAGDRAGDRMRRGTIFIRGKCGGLRRLAHGRRHHLDGTRLRRRPWAAACAAARSSARRSSECCRPSPIPESMTWWSCASCRATCATVLGAQAPRPLSGNVRKYAGDLSTIGKGEILLTS